MHLNDVISVEDLANYHVFFFVFWCCRKCHSSVMIWRLNVKERISSSVDQMFSGNGDQQFNLL